ncbi:MAG TPA: hypothetical protein VII99_02210 [Bacteroidia bacterium]
MKSRILTGWTFSRALYVLMGIFVMIQSVMQREWPGIVVGAYFTTMGIFAFGCAAGNCYIGNNQESKTVVQNTAFEEIKLK